MAEKYKPTRGDLAFRDVQHDVNPFEMAAALQNVSDVYLSVLLSSNTRDRSAGFRSQLDFELQRRAGVRQRDANFIALGGMAIAALAVIASTI